MVTCMSPFRPGETPGLVFALSPVFFYPAAWQSVKCQIQDSRFGRRSVPKMSRLRLPPRSLATGRFAPTRCPRGRLLPIRGFRVQHFHQSPGAEVTLSAAGGWNWAAGRAFLVLVRCKHLLRFRPFPSAPRENIRLPSGLSLVII